MTDHAKPTGVRRRDFLKVLGATGAATAVAGCGNTNVEKLIPYLGQPDETVPGISLYYASTCRECSVGCGVLLETRDGRTFKVEGNPVHPLNRGAICARGLAAVQGLYNPDRYTRPQIRQGNRLVPTTWDTALQTLAAWIAEARARNAGNAIFINQHETGSFPGFLDEWLAANGMPAHLSVDADADTAAIAAHHAAYGVAWPTYDFTAARLIVSFGADFLDGWGASVPMQLSFADARAKLAGAPRLVYVGPRRSLTGLNADEWIACRAGTERAIVDALRGQGALDQAAQQAGVEVGVLQRLAAELTAAKPSLVLAGGRAPDATQLALAAADLNKRLGNVGTTVRPDQPIASFDGITPEGELLAAAQRMVGGQVPILFVRGANPVFTLPAAANFAAAMGKVPRKVSFSMFPDETTVLCDLILPDHHAIESWGDAQPAPGVVSFLQPGMDPVFDTRQTADVLLDLAKRDQRIAAQYPAPNYREWLIARHPGGGAAFAQAITDGVATGTIPARAARATARPIAPAAPAVPPVPADGEYHLVVYPSPTVGMGAGANKPWLQELPDPVSKVTWITWVEVHPDVATKLEIESGDNLVVQTANGSITVPAWIYPGVRPDTIAIVAGRGHTAYSELYAKGIGASPLTIIPVQADAASGAIALGGVTARLTKTGNFTGLPSTEGSARQHGRGIARAVAVGELGHEKEEVEHIPGDTTHAFLPGLKAPTAQDAQGALPSDENLKGMYDPKQWPEPNARRWAMTIDLARCTGCSACVTACYSENNLATVGAPYQTTWTWGLQGQAGGNILRSREMNWIRIERYLEGPVSGTEWEARFVPMLCQHCGNAPCEPVCPVYATYHSPDGLNVQVYNRCVGTRYCSNNCPYKVRYFNWFGYGEPDRPQYAWPGRLNWILNPDVTVRQKGVMEKCTFCVQRIREAEHRARLENRAVRPDEFTTACAQACPSRAIVWGDAADRQWTVAQHVDDERAYHVFEELNTFTAVVYLKKVNHPAPGAPAAE